MWAAECRAIRERAVLIDQTSFAKFEITGAGTEAALQRIAANDLSGPPGKAVYTQLCNEKGGIEADVTLVHVGPDHFYLITGSGFGVRDSGWVAKHLPPSVQIRDVTNALAVINICGPRSRDILQSVTDADISNAAFPFFGARRIDVGHANVLAVRVGYVGELGYELYIPQEFGAHVYDTLWAAGAAHGIANAGYRAIDSCRMEKGYLYWSGDISPDYNPYEAGLGFCVALEKGDFIGREALAKIKEAGLTRKLCSFTIDGFAPLHGGEAIFHGGKVVGSTTSVGYGHTLAKTIAFGYLPMEIAGQEYFVIEAFGKAHRQAAGHAAFTMQEFAAQGVTMNIAGKPIAIVEAPSNLGLKPPSPGREPGTARAPAALRSAGLHELISPTRVVRVEAPAYAADENRAVNVRNVAAIADYSRKLADAWAGVFPAASFRWCLAAIAASFSATCSASGGGANPGSSTSTGTRISIFPNNPPAAGPQAWTSPSSPVGGLMS